jgi:Fe-S-cluster containining protein
MIEDLAGSDVVRGLVYIHNRANANTAELHHAAASLRALSDLLVERGLLNQSDLDARTDAASEALKREYLQRGMGVAMQEFGVSKYQFDRGAAIDCESRIKLCRGACCRLPFALSKEDVQEGIVKWDLGQPYMNIRENDGYCTHMERQSCRCSVYAARPIPCRGYDCRNDKRIWIDFENRVANPGIADPDWPDRPQESFSSPNQPPPGLEADVTAAATGSNATEEVDTRRGGLSERSV